MSAIDLQQGCTCHDCVDAAEVYEAVSALAGSAATREEVITADVSDSHTPAHYLLRDGSQSMDLIEATLTPEQFEGFLRGNALKYMIRYDRKGQAASDLCKALDYTTRLEAHHNKHA